MKKLLVIFAAVVFIWVFAAPASALDWNFYGSARMATFYTSTDLGDLDDEDAAFTWDMQGNSRIGANVKGDNISARFEAGIDDKGNNVSARRLYGVWDAGWGKIKVGKDYSPVSQFVSGQVYAGDNGLLGSGAFYGGRNGQISLAIGGFEVALISQNQPSPLSLFLTAGTIVVAPIGGDYDRYIPKIEAKYGMSFDTFNFAVRGGFQKVEFEDVVSLEDGDENDVDVTAWMIGGDFGITFGPAYIKGAVSYSQNPSAAGWAVASRADDFLDSGLVIWDGDDDIIDVDFLQACLVAGFKLSDMVTFEVGGGWTNIDIDIKGLDDFSPWAIYGQAVIQLAPGVWIIPETGYFDFDDVEGIDLPTEFYIGAKWQIDF